MSAEMEWENIDGSWVRGRSDVFRVAVFPGWIHLDFGKGHTHNLSLSIDRENISEMSSIVHGAEPWIRRFFDPDFDPETALIHVEDGIARLDDLLAGNGEPDVTP